MEAFSLYRRGYGSRAMAALRRPGAFALLEKLDRHIVGGADRFLEDCRLYRAGQRRPQLTAADLTAMLRLEAVGFGKSLRGWIAKKRSDTDRSAGTRTRFDHFQF